MADPKAETRPHFVGNRRKRTACQKTQVENARMREAIRYELYHTPLDDDVRRRLTAALVWRAPTYEGVDDND